MANRIFSITSRLLNQITVFFTCRSSSNFYFLASFVFMVLMLIPSSRTIAQGHLESYLQIAAEQNPGLQAKYKTYEVALQKVKGVSSLPDPTLSYGYFISPVETRVGPQRMKFSLSQMFPWFGTLKAQANVAALEAEAKFELFIDARNQLFQKVKKAYYPIIEIHQLISIERGNLEVLKSFKTIATKQFGSGKSSMVDVLRTDIILQEAKTRLKIMNQQVKPLQVNFNALLNRDVEKSIETDNTLELIITKKHSKDSLLANNPVLKSLELKRQAQIKNEEAIAKQGLPKLGIGLDYTVVGKRTDVIITDNGKDILMPMVSVSLPIFRKKYNAATEQSKLLQQQYELQQTDYSNTINSRYENVLFNMRSQQQYVALYNEQIKEVKQALKLLLTAYSNSGKAFEEVLGMQQQLLSYQKIKVSAITKYHIAIAEMDYITSKSVVK